MSSSRGKYLVREVLPFTALIMVECTNVGTTTLFKAAASIPVGSLDYHTFIPYSYAISTLVLIPLAFIFHRKSVLPPFSFSLAAKFLLLAIFGSSCQFLGYRGIEYSSPTLGSAMSNLIPACTFALAIIFRMEKLVMRQLSSQAKVMGTMITISGAIVVVLYKGPTVIRSALPLVTDDGPAAMSDDSNWILGGGILTAGYFLNSIWYIIQPDLEAWKIKSDIALITLLYSGIVGASFGIIVHTWALHIKGPVYVALFRPLSIAIAAVMGVVFLGDSLYLGSVVGALVISLGFYVVMWGKTQENVVDDKEICAEKLPISVSASPEYIVPLLKGYTENEPQIQA